MPSRSSICCVLPDGASQADVRRRIARILLAILLLFLCWNVWILGHVLRWRSHNPSETAFMEEQLDRLQQKRPDAELRHKWVPYNRISGHLKRALVASEEQIPEHEGFDWEGIQLAWEKNLEKGRIVAGGSTNSLPERVVVNIVLVSKKRQYAAGLRAMRLAVKVATAGHGCGLQAVAGITAASFQSP